MIYTTLSKIRAHEPCIGGWRTLLEHLGKTTPDDEPLALSTILESNGLDDALWCLRSVPEESKRWRLLAVAFASTVRPLMRDPRSLAALDVAERHARGEATDDELATARSAAQSAESAAWAAAWAATDAADAADAASAAADAAADAATSAAASAADSAAWAARSAADSAAWAAARFAVQSAAAESAAWAAKSAMRELFINSLENQNEHL